MTVLTVAVLVVIAVAIIAWALAWAWRHGSLHPSEQERLDLEFERIVSEIDAPAR